MLATQPQDAAPRSRRPKRSGGRRPRRSLAVVLVSMFAAFSSLLVIGTEDAAQAFVPPPPVFTLGMTEAAPEVLASGPVGWGIAGLATLGTLAWENWDQVTSFGDQVSCGLFGGSSCTDGIPGYMSQPNYAQKYNNYTYPDPRSITPTGIHCEVTVGTVSRDPADSAAVVFPYIDGLLGATAKTVNNPSGGTVCTSTNSTTGVTTQVTTPMWKAECLNLSTGLFRATGENGSGNSPTAPNTHNVVSPTSNANYNGNSIDVCNKGTEKVVRLEWYTSGTGATQYIKPGSWSSGEYAPGTANITQKCGTSFQDTAPITVTGTSNPDGTFTIPDCPADHPFHVGTQIDCGASGLPLSNCGGQAIDPAKAANYSSCMGTNGPSCSLSVSVDGVPCAVGKDVCWNWKTLPADRLSCSWGPYAVSLGDCDKLAYVYRTGQVVPAQGQPYPVAAQPDGSGTPDAQAAPTVTTSPVAQPSPTPQQGGANPSGSPSTNDGSNPTPDGSCWSGMISWNPLDWVLTPVECALTWAFVPPADYVSQTMSSVGSTWDGTVVGKWLGAAGNLLSAVENTPGEGGCQGPAWSGNLPANGGAFSVHPFSTCSDPQATVASITRAGLTAVVWIGAVMVCVKLVAASVGLNLGSWGTNSDGDGTGE